MLEDGLSLHKKSYVNTETPKSIPVGLLKRLRDGPRCLTPESYRELQSRTCFHVPPGYHISDQVRTRSRASIAKPSFDNRALALLDDNSIRAQPSLPRASSKVQSRTTTSNLIDGPSYSEVLAASTPYAALRNTPPRIKYHPYVTPTHVQQSRPSSIRHSPTARPLTRSSRSERDILPTSQWPEGDDSPAPANPWDLKSILLLGTIGIASVVTFWYYRQK